MRSVREMLFGNETTTANTDSSDLNPSVISDNQAKVDAINRSQAVIEFQVDGTIITANDNFLGALGYTLAEVQGQHHKIFVDPTFANSTEYAQFWQKLNNGEFQSSEFKRVTKAGQEIWIQASYNPIFDENGSVIKVVKFATDITQQKIEAVESGAKIAAISRSQAVIEFDLKGTILTANENFLSTLGYTLGEIQGQHHKIFVEPEFSSSVDYRIFWDKLNDGIFQAGEYKRIAKGGREVWIQASYNPIFDANGKVSKVIKFATDITAQVAVKKQTESIGQAVASSVNEMASTIDEVSRNVNSTASLAKTSEGLANATIGVVSALDEGSRKIGKVIEVIQDLADQTNLLALNATIEAARAGESGRSFAVVANEVKQLAGGTATATQNIEAIVIDLQANITRVVESTEKITTSISEVSLNTTSVAAAIEEQSATTASLSQTASELLSLTNS